MDYNKISDQHVIEASNRYMANMFSPTIYWRMYMSDDNKKVFTGLREFLDLVKERIKVISQ